MIADYLLKLGVFLYAFGILLPRSVVLVFAFWTNLGIASMYTFEYTQRYGIDYIAYLQ